MKPCISLGAFAALVLAQTFSAANTIVVCKDGRGDLTRVQEAIDYSAEGDVIEIADDGNYAEDLDLRSYPLRTIRSAEGKHPTINGNIILGNQCVLEGLTIEPLEYEFWGVVRCNHSNISDGCIVRRCRISGAKAVGTRDAKKGARPKLITVWWGAKGVRLTDNELSGGKEAIYVDSEPVDAVIAGNVIHDCATGIRFQNHPKDTVVEGNTLVRCKAAITGASNEAIKILGGNIFALNQKAITGAAARGMEGNLFWKNDGDFEGGIARGASDLFSDPGFADVGQGDFHLKEQAKWPRLGAYGERKLAPVVWEAAPAPAQGPRTDYRALHQKYGWLQDKLGMLLQEGGVVEVPAGVHELRSTLVLHDRQNITLRGQGREKTRFRMLSPIRLLSAKHCRNLQLEDFSVEGAIYHCVYWYEVKDSAIRRMHFTGAYMDICDDSSLEKSEIAGGSLWLTSCRRIQVTQNSFGKTAAGYSHIIDLNGMNRECVITHNSFTEGYPIHVYSASHNNVISDNLFTRMNGSAIEIAQGKGNLIARNVIRECREGPKSGAIFFTARKNSNSVDNRVIGNVIYNNAVNGIKFWVPDPVPDHPRIKESLKTPNVIEGNVIFGNAGAGIDWALASQHSYDIPLVRDNIVVANKGAGIIGSKVRASFNDVWENAGGDYKDCSSGEGAISADPLFADPAGGDFHLKSQAGRWDPKANIWIKDEVQSPCIDAGDPEADFTKEPAPNGGRINIGAYGNTGEASRSLGNRKEIGDDERG
jgi:hypothetical protein